MESYASNRAADLVLYNRNIDTAMGTPPTGPTFIGTDSSSHEEVLNHAASPNKSKHFLKQYVIQTQRVHEELIAVGKIDDANMPADFLTKWISGRKFARSIAYATNSSAFVPRKSG